jgi:HSP20 family molecular chaperone IbpA
VTFDSNTLTLHATKSEKHEEKSVHYFHRERKFGSMTRVIPLPANLSTTVEPDKEFADGVLRMVFDKK